MLTAQHLPAQACVPGTHKSNLRGPPSLYTYEEHQDLVHQEVCKAGDGAALLAHKSSSCAKATESSCSGGSDDLHGSFDAWDDPVVGAVAAADAAFPV